MSDIKCLEIFQIEIGPICFRDTGKIGQIVKPYMYMGYGADAIQSNYTSPDFYSVLVTCKESMTKQN